MRVASYRGMGARQVGIAGSAAVRMCAPALPATGCGMPAWVEARRPVRGSSTAAGFCPTGSGAEVGA